MAFPATAYFLMSFEGWPWIPEDFYLEGSNDDLAWDLLDSQTGASIPAEGAEFVFPNTSQYQYYRLTITKVAGEGTSITVLDCFELRLVPGGATQCLTMTSPNTPSPAVATADSEAVGQPAYYPFDGHPGGYYHAWYSDQPATTPNWIKYDSGPDLLQEVKGLWVCSAKDIVLDLGDNAGAYKVRVRDSDEVDVFSVDSDGTITPAPTPAAHTHTSIDATADSSIAADKKFLLEGAGSDSYIIYNSTTKQIELYVDGVLASAWGYNGLKLLMDGTTSILDLISGAAFTMTGGVGNTWPGDSSNFLPMLGAQAPVIAQATNNLLSDEDASFEGGTVGTWLDGLAGVTHLSNSATWSFHGTKSLKWVTTANESLYQFVTAITTAGLQYTASCRVQNASGATRTLRIFFSDNVAGNQLGPSVVIADGAVGTITATFTFGAGSTSRTIRPQVVTDAGTFYLDAIQLEAGATQTPFALDSRTASAMSIPTATIGLTAGQPLTIMCVVNTQWAGNDGVGHVLFSNLTGAGAAIQGFLLFKAAANDVEILVYRDSTHTKYKRLVANAGNWAANANHVVFATLAADNTLQIYLDGTAGTVASGTGVREVALNATTDIGQASTYYPATPTPLNGAILCAIWGRVLTSGEITALTSTATWGTAALGSLPAIGSTRFDDVTDRLYVYTSNGWKYATLT